MVDPKHNTEPDMPQVPWPWRGGPEHLEMMNESDAIQARINQVDRGLDLIAYAVGLSATSLNEGPKIANELAAVACYTRAFRGLRAATILATEGLYLEARVYVRDVYEAAGLGRLLAREPKKADDWLVRERWVKDNEVRQYAENFTAPGQDPAQSPYREYYRRASQIHHPTARGCLPLVLTGPDEPCRPQLASEYDAETLDQVLREIGLETVFVCFTIINAVADQEAISPAWRKAVSDLAKELAADLDWSHLDRDWTADQQAFDTLLSHVVDADGTAQALEDHPNSTLNVKRRRDGESTVE